MKSTLSAIPRYCDDIWTSFTLVSDVDGIRPRELETSVSIRKADQTPASVPIVVVYHNVNWPGAQYVLVQTALTALTLRPEPSELLLQGAQLSDLLLVEPGLQGATVLTHSARRLHGRPAPDTRLPLPRERRETPDLRGHHRLGPRVVSLYKHDNIQLL